MKKFWIITQAELFKVLKTSSSGLSEVEAQERLSTYGFNKLKQLKKHRLFLSFLLIFTILWRTFVGS